MFDIGFFELLVIAIVGLLVIGPERLPEAVRAAAKWWSRIKHTLSNARQELEREVGADDIRREIHNEAVLRELRESREQIEKAVSGREPTEPAAEDYLPEQEEDEEGLNEALEDPEYPEHLHDHGDPELNPDHPQHGQDKPPRKKDSDS